ncbi:histone H2B.11-like [Iris pallida]|uniref:Histone H2B.11-like n=1 Tax=Iris pallida TaxID=29817 RepID=A0AAX6GPT3_IRIPA|nr:histone H2B.11-like [Iris pallida]
MPSTMGPRSSPSSPAPRGV